MAIKAFQIPSSFEVRFVDYPNGCERPHTHSSLIISAVLGGYIAFQINENEIFLRKGVVAVVGPNILHCARSYSNDFSGVYILEVFGLPASFEQFNSIHFQMFKSQLLQDANYKSFLDLCEKLLSQLDKTQKIRMYSEWLRNLFGKHYPSQIKGNSGNSLLADKIRNILDNHKGETPPFEEISQLCNYSKEHCNRIFRRAFNISIQAYFLNKKATLARDLLVSNSSLSEIVFACGFYDQSHFCRIFKDIFQISPAKYRELILESRHSHTIQSKRIAL
jgi:AraC-like DNA-binding protein